MLGETQPQITLWDAALPPELTQLGPELAKVGKILDDDRFLAPYRRRFNTKFGRRDSSAGHLPSSQVPELRYGLGYVTLVREVAGSVIWRRFCRIPLKSDAAPFLSDVAGEAGQG